ncbi:hypothetical protein KUL25_01280 [Rhodobacteraceae bacterium N5(2021)]|uniref:Uncharacterized protein n=1 Tax=Gymnodinialimonas phycosphaerae TaxID=2841589 RepID=A0A975TUY5_9RHOB|nr:hypothetical protein [Gymnodinialimonas phycosphaerae]MBY4891390.1 hypothetical protein [Gymnodinialimonas phycosphaerae]
MRRVSHGALLTELIALRDGTPYPLKTATDAFVKGVAGTFPRGRSVLLDYLRLHRFQPHDFEGDMHCDICGLPREAEIRADAVLASAQAGHSSNEMPETVSPRWEEVLTLIPGPATAAEHAVLGTLLRLIEEAPEDETPGALEKRIAKAAFCP